MQRYLLLATATFLFGATAFSQNHTAKLTIAGNLNTSTTVNKTDTFNQTNTSDSVGVTYVYICNSSTAYAYHAYKCRGLQKCTHEIQKITEEEAIKDGRKPCKICYRQ